MSGENAQEIQTVGIELGKWVGVRETTIRNLEILAEYLKKLHQGIQTEVNEDRTVTTVSEAVELDRQKTVEFYKAIGIQNTYDLINSEEMTAVCGKDRVFVSRAATSLQRRNNAGPESAAVVRIKYCSQAAKDAKLDSPVWSLVYYPFNIVNVVSTAMERKKEKTFDLPTDVIEKIVAELQDELNVLKNIEGYSELVVL